MSYMRKIQLKRSPILYSVIDPTTRRIEPPKSTRELVERAVVGILGGVMLGFFLAWLALGH